MGGTSVPTLLAQIGNESVGTEVSPTHSYKPSLKNETRKTQRL
ncbi:DUF6053 domain-containing protein [Lysobacter enzymogenes]